MANIPVALQNNSTMLGALFFTGIGIGVLVYVLMIVRLYILNNHKKHYIAEIRFPEIKEYETEAYISRMRGVFDTIFRSVSSQTDKVFFEILKTNGYITIQAGSNSEELLEHVRSAFSQIPYANISGTKNEEVKWVQNIWAKNVYTSEPFYPITKNIHFFDNVINLLAGVPAHETAGVQIILRGLNKKCTINWKIQEIEKRRKSENRSLLTEKEQKMISMYETKKEGNVFKTKIKLFSTNEHMLSSLVNLFSTLNYNENILCSQRDFVKNIEKRYLAPETAFTWIPVWREYEGSYLTASELSYLFHPSSIHKGAYAPQQTKDLDAVPELLEENAGNILIGKTGGKNLYFPLKNFVRHIYLVGKTGRGKSTLLVSMLSALGEKQRGNIWVIDPHGDLLHDTMNAVKAVKDIRYFNIKDQTRVFTMNPLFAFRKTQLQKAALQDIIVDIIKRETEEQTGGYQSGSMTQNRIEQLIALALEFPDAYYTFLLKKGVNKPNAENFVYERQITLNDLPYLLVPEYNYLPLLRAVFSGINSPTWRYVERQMAAHQNQQPVVEAVQSRLKQVLHASLQYVFEGNAFRIEHAIDTEHMFLVPVQKTVFGSRGSRILMQVLFSLLWHYKQDTNEQDRKETYVFIDEFQNAQIKSFEDIIPQSRKYKLSVAVSNQHLGQLKPAIQDTIFGNVGTLVSFGVGADEIGAKTLAPNFGDSVTEKDLTMLPPYQAYLKTEGSKEKPSITLSFTTIPMQKEEKDTKTIDEINETTLNTYGEKISVLEDRLNRKQENPLKYFTQSIHT